MATQFNVPEISCDHCKSTIVNTLSGIEDIESVSKYLTDRPELVDVGIQPKLIINGSAHPTGVNKS